MPVSRDAVIWAYRLFLNREPENESAVANKLGFATHQDLAKSMVTSREFQEKGFLDTWFAGQPRQQKTSAEVGQIRSIRFNQLPSACFTNPQASQINGTLRYRAEDEPHLTRIRITHHTQHKPDSLTGVELNLKSIPETLHVAISGSDQRLNFGENCQGAWLFRMWGAGTVNVGNGVTSNGLEVFVCDRGLLEIGDDVMIATATIHVGDNHAIFDVETGAVLNLKERPTVRIGQHVWLASKVSIIANTIIGDGSIVAAGTIARGEYARCSLIAGTPGKVVKSRVSWTRCYHGTRREEVRQMLGHVQAKQAALDAA